MNAWLDEQAIIYNIRRIIKGLLAMKFIPRYVALLIVILAQLVSPRSVRTADRSTTIATRHSGGSVWLLPWNCGSLWIRPTTSRPMC